MEWQVGETPKCQIQKPRGPLQKQLRTTTTTIRQATLGLGRLGSLPAPGKSSAEGKAWLAPEAGAARVRAAVGASDGSPAWKTQQQPNQVSCKGGEGL